MVGGCGSDFDHSNNTNKNTESSHSHDDDAIGKWFHICICQVHSIVVHTQHTQTHTYILCSGYTMLTGWSRLKTDRAVTFQLFMLKPQTVTIDIGADAADVTIFCSLRSAIQLLVWSSSSSVLQNFGWMHHTLTHTHTWIGWAHTTPSNVMTYKLWFSIHESMHLNGE